MTDNDVTNDEMNREDGTPAGEQVVSEADFSADDSADEHAREYSPADDSSEDGDSGSGEHSANREAAKYRRRLRTAEAERDEARATAERLRGEIEQLVSAREGINLDVLRTLDESEQGGWITSEGGVDTERLANTLRTTAGALGINVARRPLPVPEAGAGFGGARGLTWGDAFRR